jgi:hypothetical protein
LWVFGLVAHICTVQCPFKSCKENNSILNTQNYLGAFSKYVEWICTYIENMRKKSVIYWEHAKWICTYTENMWNKVSFWMKFCYAYLLNALNEPVCILRIRRMNLSTRNESVCILRICGMHEVKYLSEFKTIIKNVLECLSGA